MQNDYIVESIITNQEKNKKKRNRKIKIIVFSIILLVVLSILYMKYVYAGVPVKYNDKTDTLNFILEHNLTNTDYKYYGYGYTVSIWDKDAKKYLRLGINNKTSYFLSNEEAGIPEEFSGSTENVSIPMDKIFEILNIKDRELYYHNNLQIRLNARIGIRIKDVLKYAYDTLEGNPASGIEPNMFEKSSEFLPTGSESSHTSVAVPLNPVDLGLEGIKNGLYNRYGINWSLDTRNNFKQHFGLCYDLNSRYTYDGYRIRYVDENGNELIYQKPKDDYFNAKNPNERIYPEDIQGYIPIGKCICEVEKNKKQYKKPVTIDYSKNGYYDLELKTETTEPLLYTLTFIYKEAVPEPPKDGYTKYKVRFVDEKTNKEIKLETAFTSPNEYKTETIIPSVISEYDYVKKYKINYYAEDGYTISSEDGTGNPSIEIKQENYYYIITLYYKKGKPVAPEPENCSPSFTGNSFVRNIYLTDKEFESLTKIKTSILVGVCSPMLGFKSNGEEAFGLHEFSNLSIELYDYDRTIHVCSFSSTSKYSFIQDVEVNKSDLVPSEIEEGCYDYKYGYDACVKCCCGSEKTRTGTATVRVHVKVNHPPVANHNTYTELIDINGKKTIKNTVFVNSDCKIKNSSYDEDGVQDIKTMTYEFEDKKGNKYYINTECTNGKYTYKSDTLPSHIVLRDVFEDGSLIISFNTTDIWNVSQTVTDQGDLSDTYNSTITPKLIVYEPIAELIDQDTYRFPNNTEFTGKQNRTVAISAGTSKISEFWEGLGIEIDHSKDYIEIIPLDGQDIKSIKFDKEYSIEYSEDKLNISNINLKEFAKLMFKETGSYKLRLKVTDTKGYISDFTEKTFIITEDKLPTVTASTEPEIYRDSTGVAIIEIKDIVCKSLDKDIAEIEEIYYLYDSNNDGNFSDEEKISLEKESYVSFHTKDLGRYKLYISVKENFGQDSLLQYITDEEIKKSHIELNVVIYNKAPTITNFRITRDN